MAHENLNIALDLDQLLRALKRKTITPKEWIDKRGCKHRSVILFAKVCEEKETKTHNITAKDNESWSDARNEEGNILFFGSARPSRFQPYEKKTKDEYDV